jgi:hypothetical protein
MSGLYKIRGSDNEDVRVESNRIFAIISDRLDKIEGYRGEPKVWNRQVFTNDAVVDGGGKGVVLKDDGSPANYWRVTIDSAGTLVQTSLGREYK